MAGKSMEKCLGGVRRGGFSQADLVWLQESSLVAMTTGVRSLCAQGSLLLLSCSERLLA